MNPLEVGQVIALKIRYNNVGVTASGPHPYIIVSTNDDYVEVLQVDSLKGKERKAAFRSNKTIFCDNPNETVIDVDSYAQLDNRFTIEQHLGLLRFRRQTDKLSQGKLKTLIEAYREYQSNNVIDENKIVHMTVEEIEELNNPDIITAS
jgi:hypothetical protein